MDSEKPKTSKDSKNPPDGIKLTKPEHPPSLSSGKKTNMPKETQGLSFDKILSTQTFILSHLTLLILALVFFGGLYYILYPERFAASVTEYVPITKEPVSLFLEISSPEDDILVSDGNLVISGKTGPDASVIISNQTTDMALQASKNGEFSKVFPLNPGPNIIEINAFDSEGNSKSTTKSVFYSEEKI